MDSRACGRILIVDDEADQVQALCATLRLKGFQTKGYSSARQALAETGRHQYDIVLADLVMPEMDGITLIRSLQKTDESLCGVIMTGHGTVDSAVAAMRLGAVDYIQKPLKLRSVLQLISRALATRQDRIQDVADLEQQRQRVSELEAANQQLEAFSHSVSHDLRAPLHAIGGFCDLFLSDFSDSISEEGRHLLRHVTESATRMNQIIDDLLVFCQSSRQPLSIVRVPTSALAARIAATLRAEATERRIELNIQPLPDCDADPSLLEQVFVNLLSNALKFTRDRDPAVIEVGHLTRAGQNVFFVRDNGVGFDMSRASRLFGVFERLHSAVSFEGSGIGLSIVRNIVERHGGTIWAESESNVGATFYFTLAAANTRGDAPAPASTMDTALLSAG